MPTQDFTTSNPLVIHQHVDDIVRRSPADGKIFNDTGVPIFYGFTL